MDMWSWIFGGLAVCGFAFFVGVIVWAVRGIVQTSRQIDESLREVRCTEPLPGWVDDNVLEILRNM